MHPVSARAGTWTQDSGSLLCLLDRAAFLSYDFFQGRKSHALKGKRCGWKEVMQLEGEDVAAVWLAVF